MNILISEFKKTIKLKDILVLMVIGPIFLTFLIGGAYLNCYVEKIPLAVLDEDNSKLSRDIIQNFAQNEKFELKYNIANKEELQKIINSRKAYLGIYIPNKFSKLITESNSSPILIIIDGSNMVIANNALASASTITLAQSQKLQIKLLESKDLLNPQAENMASMFNITERMLYDPKLTYMNYLIIGFISLFIQQVMLAGCGSSLIYEKSSNIKLKNIFAKIISCSVLTLFSMTISLLIAKQIFHAPLRGYILIGIIFSFVFCMAISCPALIMASIVKDKVKFSQISFMLSFPTFFASGYVWPEYLLPKWFVIIEKLFWPLINFAKPLDEYLIKGYFPFTSFLWLTLYILIWAPITILILNRDNLYYKELFQQSRVNFQNHFVNLL